MSTVKMVEYEEAQGRVKEIYDDIKAAKRIDWIPNFWKTLGHSPPLLDRVWNDLQDVMAPGRLDPLGGFDVVVDFLHAPLRLLVLARPLPRITTGGIGAPDRPHHRNITS